MPLPTSHRIQHLSCKLGCKSPLSLCCLIMSRDPLVIGNVVGDILDPFVKSANLRVIYNNKELINGSELKPSAITDEPRAEIRGRDMRTLYTLVSVR